MVPPTLIEAPAVPYPTGLDRGPQVVDVEITLDAHGAPTEVTLVAGEEPFAAAVLAAVRSARFTPAREQGLAVPVVFPMRWTFELPPENVVGVIRRRGDGAPAPGLVVRVGDRVVVTDAEGRFALRNLAPGEHLLSVDTAGYHLPDVPFVVEPVGTVTLDVRVLDEGGPSEAVGVYGRRTGVATRYSLDHDAIAASPGAIGDPVRALANVPGVLRTPLDTGWLLVRGGFPDDTGVYLDGVRVPRLYHLGGLTSILHPELIARVSLYPGAPPARLGRSLAGAAELELVGRPERPRVVGGVNLAFAHLFAEAPVGPTGGVTVAVRRSYLDGVLGLALGEAGARIAPRFWDAELKVDAGRVQILAVGLFDAAEAPLDDGDVASVTQRAGQIQASGSTPVGRGALAVRSWLSFHRQGIAAPIRSESEGQLAPGLRMDWIGHDVPIAVGIEAQHARYSLRRDDDPSDPAIAEVRRSGPYGYVDPWAETVVGDVVQARIGIRLDTLFVQDQLPRAGASPRLALSWHVHGPWTLGAELAQSHQVPGALYLIALPDGAYLRLERARTAEAGVAFDDGPWSASATGWTRRLEHLAMFERDGSVGQLDGRAAGAEVTVRYTDAWWTSQLVYAYTRSETREAAGDAWTPMPYEQRHLLHVLVQRELPRNWATGARWRYDSGVPASPDGVTAYDLLKDEEVEVAPSRAGRLPAWHALDLRVSRRFAFRKWALDAFLDVQNVYGRRIPEPAINGIDETQIAYGYGLPILPIFGVEGVFWPGQGSERQRRDSATSAR